jgi:hypothetical protein
MSRIGSGGPPKPPATPIEQQPADLKSRDGVQQFKEAVGKDVPQKVVDTFQRAAPGIEARLANLSSAQLASKLNFTNQDLAMLARTFAAVLKNKPNASRHERSKLFAKAILKKKGLSTRGRLADLLDDENEEHSEKDRRALEELYEMIATQLDSTPVFAQLVEEVTESVRKIR